MALPRTRTMAAVSLLSAASLLAACAPGQVESDDPDDAPEEVEPADPADFAGQTLNYVYFTDGPDEQATRELIAEFEEEYDVTVELEILAYADLVTSVTQRLTSGSAPDVVRLTNLGEFQADLLPLDPYLGTDYAGEFLEGPRVASTNDDGQLIAIPSDLTINGPFVNFDLFEEAGVDLPDIDDPWTWDEFIAAAQEVQDATGTAYALAIDKSGHRVSTVLSQYGTALLDDDGLALDAAAAEEALQPLVELMQDDVMPRDFWIGSGTRYEAAHEIFLAQDTPVYISGNWMVGYLDDNAEFAWGAAPNPCAAECGGFPGGKFMAAFRESDNPALAAEFIRFMNETEHQELFVATAGALPTRVDLTENGVTYPETHQQSMDVFLVESTRTPAFGFASNGNPAFGASGTELVNQLSEVVVGNKDLTTAISDLEAHIESVVEEIGSW